jgi:hypothetical protein
MPLFVRIIDDTVPIARDPDYVVDAGGGVSARQPVGKTVNTAAATVPTDNAVILVQAARVPSRTPVFQTAETVIAALEAQFGPATVTAHPAALPEVAAWAARV